MKNEEKAMEIIGNGCQRENCLECGGSLSVENGCVQFRRLMEMAEWMQKEMIEKMENFVKGLYLPAYPYQDRENSELIEDIKQAMMEE